MFPWGANNAGSADYSAVKGRRVAIWTDHDAQGATAQQEASKAATKAGAASVQLVPMAGKEGDGQGAANCPPNAIDIFLGALKPWEGPAVLDFDAIPVSAGTAARRDWKWRDLGDFADIPAAAHLVNGLLIHGNITLWYAPVKTGKSRLLMGLTRGNGSRRPGILRYGLGTDAYLAIHRGTTNGNR